MVSLFIMDINNIFNDFNKKLRKLSRLDEIYIQSLYNYLPELSEAVRSILGNVIRGNSKEVKRIDDDIFESFHIFKQTLLKVLYKNRSILNNTIERIRNTIDYRIDEIFDTFIDYIKQVNKMSDKIMDLDIMRIIKGNLLRIRKIAKEKTNKK